MMKKYYFIYKFQAPTLLLRHDNYLHQTEERYHAMDVFQTL